MNWNETAHMQCGVCVCVCAAWAAATSSKGIEHFSTLCWYDLCVPKQTKQADSTPSDIQFLRRGSRAIWNRTLLPTNQQRRSTVNRNCSWHHLIILHATFFRDASLHLESWLGFRSQEYFSHHSPSLSKRDRGRLVKSLTYEFTAIAIYDKWIKKDREPQ